MLMMSYKDVHNVFVAYIKAFIFISDRVPLQWSYLDSQCPNYNLDIKFKKKNLLCSLLLLSLSLPLNIYLKASTSTIEESVSYYVDIQELIIDVC